MSNSMETKGSAMSRGGNPHQEQGDRPDRSISESKNGSSLCSGKRFRPKTFRLGWRGDPAQDRIRGFDQISQLLSNCAYFAPIKAPSAKAR